jgi:hypothetical protein
VYTLELYDSPTIESLEIKGKDCYNNDEQTLIFSFENENREIVVKYTNSDNITFKGVLDTITKEIIGTVDNHEGGFGNFDLKMKEK